MTIFLVNQVFGLQLVTSILLANINAVSPHLNNQDIILNDNDFKVTSGDVCPNAEDIKPCRCSQDEQEFITMECSEIEDEEHLKEVFSKDFPVKDLYALQIICDGNNTINALRSGDLGNISFGTIFIADCGLTVVEEAALERSYDTLTYLTLQGNRLTSIPDLSKFENLAYLYLVDNDIEAFPNISSKSIVNVNLGGNNFSTIPSEALIHMPALTQLHLYYLNLTDIAKGAFDGKENLTTLDLSFNSLQVWPHDIKLQGKSTDVWLYNNSIAEIDPGSFAGLTSRSIVDLRHNALTELHEDPFANLLEAQVDVRLLDNPFGCGCDIKWLILNTTLLDRLYIPPHCANGTSFVDLDPVYYEKNC